MTAARQIAQSDVLPLVGVPKLVAGVWYLAAPVQAMSAGQAPGAGSIRLYPFFINQTITIDNLAVYVSTLSAGGNVQAAIFASDANNRPTGSPLVSTGSMSTAAVGPVSAAASLQLGPGLYWFATNCDNGTAVFAAQGSTSTWMAANIGSTTLANVITSGALSGLTFAQTFGTWPNLTSQTLVDANTSQRIPLVLLHTLSVP